MSYAAAEIEIWRMFIGEWRMITVKPPSSERSKVVTEASCQTHPKNDLWSSFQCMSEQMATILYQQPVGTGDLLYSTFPCSPDQNRNVS